MHFAGQHLGFVTGHHQRGPWPAGICSAVLHLDLAALAHGGVGALRPAHAHTALDGAVLLLQQLGGSTAHGQRAKRLHRPRLGQVGVGCKALGCKACVHLRDGCGGFLQHELQRAVHIPGAGQHHEGFCAPAIAAQGQGDGVKQLQRIGPQLERQVHHQGVTRVAHHDARHMQGLRGIAHGGHVDLLHQLPAIAAQQCAAHQGCEADLLVVLRLVPDLRLDGVELLHLLAVYADGNGALRLSRAIALHHGQVVIGQGQHRGGVNTGLDIQLAARKRPAAAHGLHQVIKRALGWCAIGDDAGRPKQRLCVGHTAHHISSRNVARVGSGHQAGVFRSADACGLAKLGVGVHMAQHQGGVFAPHGGGGARVIQLGTAHHGRHRGHAGGESRLVVSELDHQVSHPRHHAGGRPVGGECSRQSGIHHLASTAQVLGDLHRAGGLGVLVLDDGARLGRGGHQAHYGHADRVGISIPPAGAQAGGGRAWHIARQQRGRGAAAGAGGGALGGGDGIGRGGHVATAVQRDQHVVEVNVLNGVHLMARQCNGKVQVLRIGARAGPVEDGARLAHPAQHQLARGHGGHHVDQTVHLGGVVLVTRGSLCFACGTGRVGQTAGDYHRSGNLGGVHDHVGTGCAHHLSAQPGDGRNDVFHLCNPPAGRSPVKPHRHGARRPGANDGGTVANAQRHALAKAHKQHIAHLRTGHGHGRAKHGGGNAYQAAMAVERAGGLLGRAVVAQACRGRVLPGEGLHAVGGKGGAVVGTPCKGLALVRADKGLQAQLPVGQAVWQACRQAHGLWGGVVGHW